MTWYALSFHCQFQVTTMLLEIRKEVPIFEFRQIRSRYTRGRNPSGTIWYIEVLPLQLYGF